MTNVTKFPDPAHVAERKRAWSDCFETLMLSTGMSELEVARLRVELSLNWFVATFPPGKDRNAELDAFAAMIEERRDWIAGSDHEG